MIKNKVTVNINGNEYIIKGEESEIDMLEVASYVDGEIKKLTAMNNKLNPTFAAVLSSLNIANELFKQRKELDGLRISAQDPVKQLNELKMQYSSTLKESAVLKRLVDSSSRELDEGKIELKNIKDQFENLHNDYIRKSEELSKSYRECELIRREKENKHKELERVKIELSEAKYKLIDLQNQLLQNQIDFVKIKREYDDYKLGYNQGGRTSNI